MNRRRFISSWREKRTGEETLSLKKGMLPPMVAHQSQAWAKTFACSERPGNAGGVRRSRLSVPIVGKKGDAN